MKQKDDATTMREFVILFQNQRKNASGNMIALPRLENGGMHIEYKVTLFLNIARKVAIDLGNWIICKECLMYWGLKAWAKTNLIMNHRLRQVTIHIRLWQCSGVQRIVNSWACLSCSICCTCPQNSKWMGHHIQVSGSASRFNRSNSPKIGWAL